MNPTRPDDPVPSAGEQVAAAGPARGPAKGSQRRQLFSAVGAVAAGVMGYAALRHPARALSITRDISDLTWLEVRDAIQSGIRTVVVPSGGIEQNGPHMIIGKHDHIVA